MSEDTPTPRKSRTKLIVVLIVFALVVLGGGAAGAYVWMNHGGPASSATAARPEPQAVVALEPFVVNLADKDASRFLRVTMRLVVQPRDEVEEFKKDEVKLARARSAILELLTVQTADRLTTPDGKTALKKSIADAVASVTSSPKVVDVLFADFVVQF